MHLKLAKTAVITIGGIAALGLGAAPAALASPHDGGPFVPCNANALSDAISSAPVGATLDLTPGCTYNLRDALPEITQALTIVGQNSTLERDQFADAFSILSVSDTVGANLTVVGVNFNNGGGNDTISGGAIDNLGTLTIQGGTFQGNTGGDGGAIYNDGTMTVSDAASFTRNTAELGGAIDNESDATVSGSSFTFNNVSDSTPADAWGGAIYTEDSLALSSDGFLANSADGYGGAIYNDDTVTARHITVTQNTAGDGGGGIYNDDNTIDLTGNSTVFGNQPDNCAPTGTVTGCLG